MATRAAVAEAEFVGAENGSNQNVSREAEAAVHAE